MTIYQAYNEFLQLSTALYGEREGQSVARLVFEDALGIRNIRREDRLSEDALKEIKRIAEHIKAGEPVQYAIGQAHFYGLQLHVDHRVLIPRPETEELVHWILEDHKQNDSLKVLDIGTGSGCIALALKKQRPQWEIYALDLREETLDVARTNALHLSLDVHFIHMDFLDKNHWVQLSSFDIIVSNPPYIPYMESHLMPDQVLRFEPHHALFVQDEQPLIFYQRIACFGLTKLVANGKVYVETNEFNAQKMAILFTEVGYRNVVVERDMQGKKRMVRALLTPQGYG